MSFRVLEAAVIGICNTTFGTSLTYTPIVGAPVTITGVFDNAFIDVNEVSSLRPVLRIKLADLALAPAKGDLALINAVSYRVLSAESDSFGGSLLVLQKV